MSTQQTILAIDIGGTQTRISIFGGIATQPAASGTSSGLALAVAPDWHRDTRLPSDLSAMDPPYGRILARYPTPPDYDAQLQAISAVVRSPSASSAARPAAIGVAIGAQLARDGRSVLAAPNLPTYVARPFAADLEAALSCPVWLGHDTVCGLLAERWSGAVAGEEAPAPWDATTAPRQHAGGPRAGVLCAYDRCAYLTLSTGTGAAFHLRQGARELTCSIEFAHQILEGNTRRCLCGQVGCLETYTGGRQMARFASPDEIATAAFWETFSDKLAIGLVNLAKLTRVEAVAIAGGIALARPNLLADLQPRVDARLAAAHLTLLAAAFGEHAPRIGAALLPSTPPDQIVP